ncbi:MAG: hypothetical protein KBC06_00160 [Candidatus Pacebacteria bacterium]|nr:hypothetical protein [Candidatus Paceibacterota bacterium]
MMKAEVHVHQFRGVTDLGFMHKVLQAVADCQKVSQRSVRIVEVPALPNQSNFDVEVDVYAADIYGEMPQFKALEVLFAKTADEII